MQVKKYWIDDNNSMNTRPVSVTIKAEHKNTHEVKTYVLNKDNNWAMQTDIKRGEEGNYTFSEVCNAKIPIRYPIQTNMIKVEV